MRIKDIAIFNPKGNKPEEYINYIDTSSVEDGKLHEVQTLSREIPSRAQRLIALNDILISSVRPNLRHNYFVNKEIPHGIASTGFIQIRVISSNVNPQFLYYFLTSEQKVLHYQTIAETSQSTFPSFNKDVIEGLDFPNVTLDDQQHIVDILGSIDAKIENNEQLINIFENLAAKKYLDFANKTSTKIRLEDVIELCDSKRIPLSSREREQRKGIYPYYGATGILDYVNGFLFSGEYVLFAEDGTVTDTNGHPIVQLVNGSFWVNNHAHILKGKNGWHDYTLYVALKQLNVDKAVTGAVQPKINQANLLSLEIPNLSNNNLQTINTELDVVFHKVFHLRSENKSLQELKGLYLKKFFE